MIESLNALLWGKVLIFVLIPVGLWFTVRSRFVQARYFAAMFSILGEAKLPHRATPDPMPR